MSSRSMRVRTKVVALLLSLVALWAFAAFVTLREGLNLLWVATLDKGVATPNETLLLALEQERRLSMVFLGSAGRQQQAALMSQRERTNEARSNFEELARGTDVRLAASAAAQQRIGEAIQLLTGLEAVRASIDDRTVDRARAASAFTDVINAGYRIYDSLGSLDDPDVAKDVRTLIMASRAREVLSQEDALLAGVLAAGRFGDTEHGDFVRLVGAQRFLYTEAEAELPPADKARYRELVSGAAFLRFRNLEDRVIDKGRAGTAVPIGADEWTTAVDAVFAELLRLEQVGGDDVVSRATPAAVWVIVRLLLAGGLGLIAVVASIIVSITTARSLIRQLEKLRNAAWELSTERLPRVVERLRRGDEVDVAAEAPPLTFGSDEIGQVGQAFNAVQQTAIRTAVEQAELRKSVRDVFLSLARRTQALVHRQLRMLDAMERRETNAEELDDLFRVDHLATRMRRNAENLIVLSGALPGRGWRNAVPLVDVVRGAVAEVEDYTRVTVLPIGPTALEGRAVGDVIHLLAELIENAVSFSPPYTIVHASGHLVANGFAVEVEDRGLGMTEADLETANEQLRNPPEFNLTSTARLGLFVVGRLAERHGIRVRLRESPYGGTTAIVLIPQALVIHGPDSPARHDAPAEQRAAISAGTGGDDVVEGDVVPDDVVPDDVVPDGALSGEVVEQDVPTAERLVRVRPRHAAEAAAAPAQAQAAPAQAAPAWAVPAQAAAAPAQARPEPAGTAAVPQDLTQHDRTPQDLPSQEPPQTSAPQAAASEASAQPAAETPFGLPRRVRQASLAIPLRDDATTAPAQREAIPQSRRPEQIREMMASYQRATNRGRLDAGQQTEAGTPKAPPAGPAQQPGAD